MTKRHLLEFKIPDDALASLKLLWIDNPEPPRVDHPTAGATPMTLREVDSRPLGPLSEDFFDPKRDMRRPFQLRPFAPPVGALLVQDMGFETKAVAFRDGYVAAGSFMPGNFRARAKPHTLRDIETNLCDHAGSVVIMNDPGQLRQLLEPLQLWEMANQRHGPMLIVDEDGNGLLLRKYPDQSDVDHPNVGDAESERLMKDLMESQDEPLMVPCGAVFPGMRMTVGCHRAADDSMLTGAASVFLSNPDGPHACFMYPAFSQITDQLRLPTLIGYPGRFYHMFKRVDAKARVRMEVDRITALKPMQGRDKLMDWADAMANNLLHFQLAMLCVLDERDQVECTAATVRWFLKPGTLDGSVFGLQSLDQAEMHAEGMGVPGHMCTALGGPNATTFTTGEWYQDIRQTHHPYLSIKYRLNMDFDPTDMLNWVDFKLQLLSRKRYERLYLGQALLMRIGKWGDDIQRKAKAFQDQATHPLPPYLTYGKENPATYLVDHDEYVPSKFHPLAAPMETPEELAEKERKEREWMENHSRKKERMKAWRGIRRTAAMFEKPEPEPDPEAEAAAAAAEALRIEKSKERNQRKKDNKAAADEAAARAAVRALGTTEDSLRRLEEARQARIRAASMAADAVDALIDALCVHLAGQEVQKLVGKQLDKEDDQIRRDAAQARQNKKAADAVSARAQAHVEKREKGRRAAEAAAVAKAEKAEAAAAHKREWAAKQAALKADRARNAAGEALKDGPTGRSGARGSGRR